MRKRQVESQPPLSANELMQIDLTRYACYPETLFLHAIVQRDTYWHTALLQIEEGKVRHSSVNAKEYAREEDARMACEEEHDQMRYLFNLILPDFDLRSVWFK